MKDHQPREFVAIDQNYLIRMTLGKVFSGSCKIRSRYEDTLCRFVGAETATEIPNVGFANGVVRIISLRLYINAIKPQLVLVDDPVNPTVAGFSKCATGIIS